MAEQAGQGTVAGLTGGATRGPATSAAGQHSTHHGRPVSWVAVVLIMIGFLVGGIGLISGPLWWVFWTGAAVTVVGSLMAAAVNVFDDWY